MQAQQESQLIYLIELHAAISLFKVELALSEQYCSHQDKHS